MRAFNGDYLLPLNAAPAAPGQVGPAEQLGEPRTGTAPAPRITLPPGLGQNRPDPGGAAATAGLTVFRGPRRKRSLTSEGLVLASETYAR